MDFERLEEKWGQFKKENHFFINCPMDFISDKAQLNVIFEAEELTEIRSAYKEVGLIELPSEVENFYKRCNGCRLFFGSLSIFGIQKYPDEVFEPYDIKGENMRLRSQMKLKNDDFVFFASLGGDYVFGLKPNSDSKIYGMEATCAKVLREFDDFNVFVDYYFDKLFEEYDEKGRKIHLDEAFAGIPALEHLTSDIFI